VRLRYRSLGPDDIDLAKDLYARGLSVVKVGKMLDCDGGTVWLALRREGWTCGTRMATGTEPFLRGKSLAAIDYFVRKSCRTPRW
jgi:uncharacterized protein YjcR